VPSTQPVDVVGSGTGVPGSGQAGGGGGGSGGKPNAAAVVAAALLGPFALFL
jgi:hypothetical protein